jgi:hypothetical protein
LTFQWLVVLTGYTVSSTTKFGRHDIAEILLKVALNTKHQKIKYILKGKKHKLYGRGLLIEHFISIEPLLRDHLPYKAT